MTKQCFKCREIKELKFFYLHKGTLDGHINKCRSCTCTDSKRAFEKRDKDKWNKNKRDRNEKTRERIKDLRLKKTYGVGLDWCSEQSKKQNEVCAICKKPGQLVLDHDHRTGKPRGMLHKTCSAALGLLKDDFDILLNAAKYIQESSGVF